MWSCLSTPRCDMAYINTNRGFKQGLIDVLSTDTAQTPGISPQDVEYLPIRGMVRNKPATQLIPSEGWTVKNMYWLHGEYKTRPGCNAIGTVLTDPVIAVFLYTNAAVGDYIVACTPEGFFYWDGASWTATTGPTLTADDNTGVSLTQWGNTVIYANGADDVGAIDIAGGTHAALTGAPVARFSMNFGRRVIVFNVSGNPERIQWCVNGNNADWAGLGSGYEDLLAAPGGVVDDALGGIPITDESAILIRRRSIWTMSRTNFADAPFQFTRRWQTQGTESPYSFKLTPAGVIGLFLDDVYLFSDTQAPVPIGTAVRKELLNAANLEGARAAYDRYLREYRLMIPPTTRAGVTKIWRYSLADQRWTYDEFPFDVSDIATEYYTIDPIIDQVDDVIDTVDIPIDDMGGVANTSGLIIGQHGSTGKVVGQLDDGNMQDITQGSTTASADIEVVVELGELTPGTSLRRVNLIEAQVEHFNANAIDLSMEYSEDRGVIWNTYDMWSLSVDPVPTIARFTKNVEAKRLAVRLYAADGAGLVISSWVLRMQTGSKHAH